MVTDLFNRVLDPMPLLPLDLPMFTNDDRILRLDEPFYVAYPTGDIILERLNWMHRQPRVSRPPCMLLYGDTNSGKTAVAEKFVHDHGPESDRPEFGRHSVVFVHSPPMTEQTSLYDAILRAVHAPYRPSARAVCDHTGSYPAALK